MIERIEVDALGAISHLKWENLQGINVVTGRNSSGKTTLLKALYAIVRTIEQYKRGNEPRSIKDLLSEKLYWTFQTGNLGKLVNKDCSSLKFVCHSSDSEKFEFGFGESTTTSIGTVVSTFKPRSQNSIFLPAKEIISLQKTILRTRDEWKTFGFDDTYYDLAKALTPATKGKNYESFSNARMNLKEVIGGRILYDEKLAIWQFKDSSNRTYPIGTTAEGVKKLGILDALLGNHYLSRDSIVFIDEPESALHPELITTFMDVIFSLAEDGIQFFLATHSYFVIKKLYLLANQKNKSIPLLSFENDGALQSDIKDGIDDSSIVGESVRLYEEELDL